MTDSQDSINPASLDSHLVQQRQTSAQTSAIPMSQGDSSWERSNLSEDEPRLNFSAATAIGAAAGWTSSASSSMHASRGDQEASSHVPHSSLRLTADDNDENFTTTAFMGAAAGWASAGTNNKHAGEDHARSEQSSAQSSSQKMPRTRSPLRKQPRTITLPGNYPPMHAAAPFRATSNRPAEPDGIFRVVIVAAGNEAARHVPPLAAALTKDPAMAVQILACPDAFRFFTQQGVDDAVRNAWNMASGSEGQWGMRVWTDADEWEGWTQPGDTVLHRELRNWADLVLVAPCSADLLAKIASGLSESAALSLLRALPPSTPVIVCPSMNADMFANAFTQQHITVIRDQLHFLVLGPQCPLGQRPARPDTLDSAGAMADWRDIAIAVQDMAALFHMRQQQRLAMAAEAEMESGRATPNGPPRDKGKGRSRSMRVDTEVDEDKPDPWKDGRDLNFMPNYANRPMEDSLVMTISPFMTLEPLHAAKARAYARASAGNSMGKPEAGEASAGAGDGAGDNPLWTQLGCSVKPVDSRDTPDEGGGGRGGAVQPPIGYSSMPTDPAPHAPLDRPFLFVPIRGLPSFRTEHDRMAESHTLDSRPLSLRPPSMVYKSSEAWKAMAGGIYWETKWWGLGL